MDASFQKVLLVNTAEPGCPVHMARIGGVTSEGPVLEHIVKIGNLRDIQDFPAGMPILVGAKGCKPILVYDPENPFRLPIAGLDHFPAKPLGRLDGFLVYIFWINNKLYPNIDPQERYLEDLYIETTEAKWRIGPAKQEERFVIKSVSFPWPSDGGGITIECEAIKK